MNQTLKRYLKRLMQDENLWFKKVIPASVRHLVSRPLEKKITQGMKIPKPFVPGKYPTGINLYGLFKSEIGLSQGAKLYARALETGKIPHTLINLDLLPKELQNDHQYDSRLTEENRYAINVVHINPMEWQEACGAFPRSHFDEHYNIAVILWELEELPGPWLGVFDYIDEVWVPSGFIAEAVKKKTEKPVITIPYGIETEYDEGLTKEDFGLKDTDFNVLMMFDSRSHSSRKNPVAAIDAFHEAFGDSPDHAKLVIKINNPKEEDIDLVREHMGGESGYILITERMEKKKLNSLIRLCDVFISMHRAEGFGLVMAEAMSLGTPAIATNWSANTEFMTEDNACPVDYQPVPVGDAYPTDDGTQTWADPDVSQAAAWLRRLRDDPAFYREKAEKGQQYIREQLSVECCAGKILDRMNEIQTSRGN